MTINVDHRSIKAMEKIFTGARNDGSKRRDGGHSDISDLLFFI
jgi:hypothetical protein